MNIQKSIFLLALLCCLLPFISSPFALLPGMILAQTVEKNRSYLISSGTAICGGSATAAISPIIKSDDKQITTDLGIVFTLNSIALLAIKVSRFLIGTNLSGKLIKSTGLRQLIQGVTVCVFISIVSLISVLFML